MLAAQQNRRRRTTERASEDDHVVVGVHGAMLTLPEKAGRLKGRKAEREADFLFELSCSVWPFSLPTFQPSSLSGSCTIRRPMEQIIHHLLAAWMQFVLDWGYLGIFVMMLFELTAVRIPAQVVIPPAAYWAAQGKLNIVGV